MSNIFLLFRWLNSLVAKDKPYFVAECIQRIIATNSGINATRIARLAHLEEWRERINKDHQEQTFYSFFTLTLIRSLQATNPCNKIYSLLGIWNPSILSNYSDSVEKVYSDFTRTWANMDGLSFLHYTSIRLYDTKILKDNQEVALHHLFLLS